MSGDFRFQRRGRSARAALALGLTWAVLLMAVVLIDAAVWLMALIALCTLPALWDYLRNPAAGVVLGEDALHWYSGKRKAELPLSEIDHIRMDTRWDFSVRVSAVLTNGKRVRLPYESLPPHRNFERALRDHGLRTQRHHFTVF